MPDTGVKLRPLRVMTICLLTGLIITLIPFVENTGLYVLVCLLLLCVVGLLLAACATGGSRRGQVSGGFNADDPYGSAQPGQPRPTVKVALLLPLSATGSAGQNSGRR